MPKRPQPAKDEQQTEPKRSGDQILQIRDEALKSWIERRQIETGTYTMAEVVRRVLTLGLQLDEVSNPGRAPMSDAERRVRAARLSPQLAAVIAELARYGEIPYIMPHAPQTPQVPQMPATPVVSHQFGWDDNAIDDTPEPGGRGGQL